MSRGPFAKVYRSLWNGTLGAKWEGWSLLVYMIAHGDANGVIDETPDAMARKSGMPLEAVERGIAILEAPDVRSRSVAEAGRRIARLDAHRDWGWRIVNIDKYRDGDQAEWSRSYRERHPDEVRERDRERKREARLSASRPLVSANVRQQAEAEAEEDRRTLPHPTTPELAPGGAAPLLVGQYSPVLALLSATAPPDDPEVVALPTNVRGRFFAIRHSHLAEWRELFPAVKVDQELREMRAWLLANPRRRKTAGGMLAFATKWLGVQQDKAGGLPAAHSGHRAGADARYRRENP